jgi:hypothetical protein
MTGINISDLKCRLILRTSPSLTLGLIALAACCVFLSGVAATEAGDDASDTPRPSVRTIQPLSSLPNPTGDCAIHALDFNAPDRKDRFPSVEERVCLYMSIWYDPHYGDIDKQWKSLLGFKAVDPMTLNVSWNNTALTTIQLEPNHLKNDVPFFLFAYNQTFLRTWTKQKHWILFACYAHNTEQVMDQLTRSESNAFHPTLFVWGDQQIKVTSTQYDGFPQLPIFAKWRFNDVAKHKLGPVPIITLMDSERHFGTNIRKKVPEGDIPWHEKKNMAFWRGAMTGIVDGKFHYDLDYEKEDDKLNVCLMFERCRFVYENLKKETTASIANIGLSMGNNMSEVGGINLAKPLVSIQEHLQYKMLISLEGNDVASGLKWSLYSKSVVLMPPPLKSIYAMEYLLEPWVHYVPLNVSDLEDAVQWVLDNDEEAQRISQRGTNFIEDLLLQEDAKAENEEVLKRIVDRYAALWIPPDPGDKLPDDLFTFFDEL